MVQTCFGLFLELFFSFNTVVFDTRDSILREVTINAFYFKAIKQGCNYKSVVQIIEHVFEIQFKSNIHFELRLNTLKLPVEGTHIPY